jgi:predicted dehydrogenase
MTEPLGLGIIGYGSFGAFTADVYASMSQLRIVAVTDTDAKRREAAAARYHALSYTDETLLLADPRVDLVAIATPPWLHGAQAIAAVRAGKHIFIEKPLATTREESEALLMEVQSRGLRLGIDYVLRYVPLYATLHALITSNLLGAVSYMALENNASNEALHPRHWFWDRTRSGGIFVEHGVHFFDLCTFLSGSHPQTIAGSAYTASDGRQERVLAMVRYSSGALATFYHAFDRPAILERTVLRVVMERGIATAHGWIPERLDVEGAVAPEQYGPLATLLGTELEISEIPAPQGITGGTAGTLVRATLRRKDRTVDYVEAVRAGMTDFVRSIREPSYTPVVTMQDAYNSLLLALSAQASADTGQIVTCS